MNGSALVAYGLLCGRGCCFDKIRRAWINFVGEGCQEDSSDICMLGLIAHFAFFSKDEAAGVCSVGSICCHSSRGRSQAFGLQIAAEQICRGGARPDLTVQHLQCWFKVRRPWSCRGPFSGFLDFPAGNRDQQCFIFERQIS